MKFNGLKEFTINGWGHEYKCQLVGDRKHGVSVQSWDDEFKFWEPFGQFTVYQHEGGTWSIKNYSENDPWADELLDELTSRDYCKVVGEFASGFVVMPVVEFTDKFWEEVM